MAARRFGVLLLGYVGTDAVLCCVVTSCLFAMCAVVGDARPGSPSASAYHWYRDALVEGAMAAFACLAGALTLAKVTTLVQVLGQTRLSPDQHHAVLSSEPAGPDEQRQAVDPAAGAPACAPAPRPRTAGTRRRSRVTPLASDVSRE